MRNLFNRVKQTMSFVPESVPQEYHHWIILAKHIDLFAIISCAVNLIFCIYKEMWNVIFCILPIMLTFSYCFTLQMKGRYKLSVPLGYLALAFGSAGAAYFTGWECGFQFYIIALIGTISYVPFYKFRTKVGISAVLFAMYLVTFLICGSKTAVYQLPLFWQNALHAINLISLIGTLLYFPFSNLNALRITAEALFHSKRHSTELERLARLKDDFLANTSHELRTPLHGISGIAESLTMDETVKSSPFLTKNLGHIITSARRLTNLVNDILDFAKMRHNDLSIHPVPIDIEQIVSSVIPNFSANAEKKGVALIKEIPQNTPRVLADEDRFIQILFNLIGNALKFTDSGSITVKAESTEDSVLISVTDTGIGIPESELPQIFDAFEQAASHNENYRGGTGLGLSITKKLVELHGGTITAVSTAGTGSTFTVELPAAELSENVIAESSKTVVNQIIAENSSSEQIVKSSREGEHTIIAIDDELINLQIIENQIELLGITVITATDGDNILEMIDLFKPTVILLDIMMPTMNGYEVCRTVRTRFSPAEMPIIFISAKNRISDLVLGFECGGNDYVLKPFLREELAARVAGQIRAREGVLAIEENGRLKNELAERLVEESRLVQKQTYLTHLLHSIDDGLLVLDGEENIVFANAVFCRLIGCDDDSRIVSSPLSGITEKADHLRESEQMRFVHSRGAAVDLHVRQSVITIENDLHTILIAKKNHQSEPISDWILEELEKNEMRISELQKMNHSPLEETAAGLPAGICAETTYDPHYLGNRIMTESLEIWMKLTGKNKPDFAQISGIWKVHADRDGWQRTCTLDKYLDIRKMPKFPRWRLILNSARFVLSDLTPKSVPELSTLEQLVKQLETALRRESLRDYSELEN